MLCQGTRGVVAPSQVSRARAVQCRALFGSTATKQASSEFYSFKVKVIWREVVPLRGSLLTNAWQPPSS